MDPDSDIDDENEICRPNQNEAGANVDETGVVAECEDSLVGGQRPARNFEDIIVAVGKPGRYQILQSALISFNFIPAVFINMSFVFIGLVPPFSCPPINETFLQEDFHTTTNETTSFHVSYKSCDIRIMSNTSGTLEDVSTTTCPHGGYIYEGGKHVSIMSEWDLVCEARGLAEMSQTVLALGWFIGVIFASTFSDKYGRKKTIAISTALSSIFELSNAFSPNIYTLLGLRFFSGFLGSGVSSITLVLGMEFYVSKYRELFCIYVGVLWSIYSMFLCAIAFIFRDSGWRNLQTCIAVCGMTPLLTIYFVDESASWLYSQGKYKQVTHILRKACRLNGLDYGEQIERSWDNLCESNGKDITEDSSTKKEDRSTKKEDSSTKKEDISTKKEAKNYNALDIFRHKSLRISFIFAWIAAFSNDISYFGMYLSASTLAGNLYVNTALMALLEIPGCVWTLFMLKHFGRRAVIIFFMIMGSVCLLASTLLGTVVENDTHHIANTSTAIFLLGRLAISNSYTTIYMYIPELFPTTLRSSGTGLSITGGCMGGMLAAYLLPLHDLVPWAPGTILISVLTLSSFLLLKLPETKGKQLASTIEDLA